jgi:hypothetical protein
VAWISATILLRSSWTLPSKYEHGLNCKLVLRYGYGDADDSRHQTLWSDGEVQRVEDLRHQFVEALLAAGERMRLARVAADSRETAFRESEVRRAEEARRRQEEEAQVARL